MLAGLDENIELFWGRRDQCRQHFEDSAASSCVRATGGGKGSMSVTFRQLASSKCLFSPFPSTVFNISVQASHSSFSTLIAFSSGCQKTLLFFLLRTSKLLGVELCSGGRTTRALDVRELEMERFRSVLLQGLRQVLPLTVSGIAHSSMHQINSLICRLFFSPCMYVGRQSFLGSLEAVLGLWEMFSQLFSGLQFFSELTSATALASGFPTSDRE